MGRKMPVFFQMSPQEVATSGGGGDCIYICGENISLAHLICDFIKHYHGLFIECICQFQVFLNIMRFPCSLSPLV